MSSKPSIPKLTREAYYSTPISTEEYEQLRLDAEALFDPTNVFLNEESIDPLADIINNNREEEYYDVEDTPSPDETNSGVLRLKMPIPKRSSGSITATDLDSEFSNPVSVHSISICNFTIPRGKMSVNQISQLIREFVVFNADLNEIVPKNRGNSTQPSKDINGIEIVYTTFDKQNNSHWSRFAIDLVEVISDDDGECIAVALYHGDGDTRLSIAFFEVIRNYVESNGSTSKYISKKCLEEGVPTQYEGLFGL